MILMLVMLLLSTFALAERDSVAKRVGLELVEGSWMEQPELELSSVASHLTLVPVTAVVRRTLDEATFPSNGACPTSWGVPPVDKAAVEVNVSTSSADEAIDEVACLEVGEAIPHFYG